MLGTMSNSCKLFDVMKWTSRITGTISGGMGLFDTAAMVVGLFDPQNAFVQFNQKLHTSKLYNGFQFTVSALAVFSSTTYRAMGKHRETLTCFVAGTMILTATGMVAIENIKTGDKVISTNPETFETGEKTVVETYVREVTTLVHLTVNGDEIITTVDHPFYVKGKGFVNAGELWVGTQLLDVNNNILVVENTRLELVKILLRFIIFRWRTIILIMLVRMRFGAHNADYEIELSISEYPESAKHIEDAIKRST